jgi:hypothetical protein
VTFSPWPFHEQEVNLVCEGRLLTETYASESDLRRSLAEAPWQTIQTRLVPA